MESNAAFIKRVLRRLGQKYEWDNLGNQEDPLDELVYILLSSRTGGVVFQRTYERVKRRYPDWHALLGASAQDIEGVLSGAGLQSKKAAWLQAALEAIERDRGELSLTFLREYSNENAEQYLTDLPGVGVKSARCILMYSLGRDVLPVDAHVFRLMHRLGLLPQAMTYRRCHDYSQSIVPPACRRQLHIYAVIHGRTTCTPRKPRCDECVLLNLCPTGLASQAGAE